MKRIAIVLARGILAFVSLLLTLWALVRMRLPSMMNPVPVPWPMGVCFHGVT